MQRNFCPVFSNLKENKECLNLYSVSIHKMKLGSHPGRIPKKHIFGENLTLPLMELKNLIQAGIFLRIDTGRVHRGCITEGLMVNGAEGET